MLFNWCELTSLYFFFIKINRVKLLRSLPPRFKVDVKIAPGTHASEEAVNKQVCSHDVSFDYKVEAHNAKLSQQRFLHCCLTKETSEHI